MKDIFKNLRNFLRNFLEWRRWKFRKKYKRLYEVYNSDAPEHIGLKMRGIPEPGTKVTIKGGTGDNKARHFTVEVFHVSKLNRKQLSKAKFGGKTEAYYIDGRYNDLEVKRIE